jgi:hypothetical protein
MSNNSSLSSSGGIGFLGLLALLFIALKLTGHIDWSWWWVLAPVWVPFALFIAFIIICYAAVTWNDSAERRRLLRYLKERGL